MLSLSSMSNTIVEFPLAAGKIMISLFSVVSAELDVLHLIGPSLLVWIFSVFLIHPDRCLQLHFCRILLLLTFDYIQFCVRLAAKIG